MFKKLIALLLALTFTLQIVAPGVAFASGYETSEEIPISSQSGVGTFTLRGEEGRIYYPDGARWVAPSPMVNGVTYWDRSVATFLLEAGEVVEVRGFPGIVMGSRYEFVRWEETGGVEFADRYSVETTFVMPAGDASIWTVWNYIGEGPAPTPEQGWIQADGNWFFYVDGVRQVGWLLESGSWFYLNPEGVMQTGWVHTGGSWFFLASSGRMQTGWLRRGTNWYFLANSGRMQTGWLRRGTNWYFLAGSGRMQTGWVQVGSNWFFMAGSGRMQTGRVIINGVPHLFNASGVWQGRG